MTRHPFSTSPSYLQYIRGVRDIHALIKAGKDDSPEADAIRDSMDKPWYNLSETEQARIRGLSEDLYSLSDLPHEALPTNPQVQRKLIEAAEARYSGNWDLALGILRRWSRHIDPALLSWMRGSLWQEAGDDATAKPFFEHAAHLEPLNGTYKFSHLFSINRIDPEQARVTARKIIEAGESEPPEALIMAAEIILESFSKNIEFSHLTSSNLIPQLEKALARLKDDGSSSFQTLHVMAIVLLSRCHAILGDPRTAIRYIDQAISVDPNEWNMITYRGVLRYSIDPRATDDFETAIRLGSREVWPYFYLAHHFLVSGQFEQCLKMCERGLDLPASTPKDLKANLHEWLAIARSELRYPPEQVRSGFEEAIRLAPDSDRIYQNLAAFESGLASPNGQRAAWIKPKASTIQEVGRLEYRTPFPSLRLVA